MILSRRSFFTGLGASILAAPAIVRAASLMPVKALPLALQDPNFDLAVRLIAYRKEITREWLRANVFFPYSDAHLGTELTVRAAA